MPANEFNIPQLLFQTFGPKGLPINAPYGVPEQPSFAAGEVFPDKPISTNDQQSQFFALQKQIGTKDLLGRPIFMPVRIDNLVLPNEPTISIEGGVNMVRTQMVGSTINKGTVKELIQTDDYKITLRGIIINSQSGEAFPEDEFNEIGKLCVKNKRVSIDNALCALLSFYDIVIESWSFPHTPAQNAQAYEIVAWSDEFFDLIIEN